MAKTQLSSAKILVTTQTSETGETVVTQSLEFSSYEIIGVNENRTEKTINAFVLLGEEEAARCFNLWKNADYDSIKKWSDKVDDKVAEIISAM